MLWHFEALHMGSLQGKINTLCIWRLLCIAMIQISNQACGNVWKVFIKPQAMRWKFSALATSEVKVSVEIEPDFFQIPNAVQSINVAAYNQATLFFFPFAKSDPESWTSVSLCMLALFVWVCYAALWQSMSQVTVLHISNSLEFLSLKPQRMQTTSSSPETNL